MLDNIGGPAKALGSDAKGHFGDGFATGASSATNATDLADGARGTFQVGLDSTNASTGIHEDASKGIESFKGGIMSQSSGQSALDTLKSKMAGNTGK